MAYNKGGSWLVLDVLVILASVAGSKNHVLLFRGSKLIPNQIQGMSFMDFHGYNQDKLT